MIKFEALHTWVTITLFLFTWSCLAPRLVRGADEDPLEKARELIKVGSFEEAERVLGAYIEKIRGIAKQKRRVADAHYLLARMYYEVGDDLKCDKSIRAALQNDPEAGKEELDPGFRKRLDGIRAEVAPKVFEKMKERQLHPKKKFPWLLVAGVVVLTVLIVLLKAKRKETKNRTLTVVVGSGVTGSHHAGKFFYSKGAKVPYNFEVTTDYKDLEVLINGVASPASGTLVMDDDILLEASATQLSVETTVQVYGMYSCFFLGPTGDPAATGQIPGGSYTVQIRGAAYYDVNRPFNAVLVRYLGADGLFHLGALSISQSHALTLGASTPVSPFHAFFVGLPYDPLYTPTRSGEITLDFGSKEIVVKGKYDCLIASSVSAGIAQVNTRIYKIRVSGSAYYAVGKEMKEVLVSYHNHNGKFVSEALAVGQTVERDIFGGNFYAYFVDWQTTNDNSGQVKLEFIF